MDTAAYHGELGRSAEFDGAWRRAALLAVGIALVELVALIVVGVALLAGPVAHRLQHHAAATTAATKPTHRAATSAPHVAAAKPPTGPLLARARTRVLVLNGNGRAGAAATEAATLATHGYPISATGNAQRSDYATTIVMYRTGYLREARRLARDTGVRVVAPLDGIHPAALKGARLVVVVGS